MRRRRDRRRGGFTLVEVLLASSMMVAVLATVGVGLKSGHDASRELRRRAQLTSVAGELLGRLLRIDYGRPLDAAASGAQLDELFDSDDDLGSATLCSLVTPAGGPGWRFSIASFPFGGEFEVRVDGDLDGNGVVSGGREGRDDLLRVTVLHDGVSILETMRAAPWVQP